MLGTTTVRDSLDAYEPGFMADAPKLNGKSRGAIRMHRLRRNPHAAHGAGRLLPIPQDEMMAFLPTT